MNDLWNTLRGAAHSDRADPQDQGAWDARSQPAIIDAGDLTKTYRSHGIEVRALDGVSLKIAAGAMVAIMGASGSGKTTLLNCLAGLDTIDSGTIHIAGQDLAEMGDQARTALRARTMGFVFQTFNLLPVLDVVENVELPLLILRVPATEARRRARALLDEVGLAHREHHRPAELSGGQRQRVAIARALINDPLIVWADEPTGSLDSEAADEIMQLFARFNQEQQQTIVIVTHAPEIGARASHIYMMRDGRLA